MIDTWNPAKLNEKISGRDSWNPAVLNEAVSDKDSWNPAILNESAGETPVVFEATITATFPEGATCTATDGTTTLTADDNPMAFSIPNEGTWAVACVANGVTFSEDVVITTNGQTETVDLTPVGETVTPTDSVPMLIACAGIGDSTYTTIAEVISDSELLTKITTNDNAIAYLVRSTAFAASITADEDVMTAIGASDECSDALLGNSTWLTAICDSTYFESVLNVKVPTMTSTTTPSGECFSSALGTGSSVVYAFDNNANTVMRFAQDQVNNYVGYKFDNDVSVNKCVINYKVLNDTLPATRNFVLQASTDNNTWTDLVSDVLNTSTPNTPLTKTFTINNITDYAYFRLLFPNKMYITGWAVEMIQIQFYGRVDV